MTDPSTSATFVPDDFDVPGVVSIWLSSGAGGRRLRLEPLGPEHNERDHAAWMGSSDFIHTLPGFRPGERAWPVPMTLEENLGDMVMHVDDFRNRVGFSWSVLIDGPGGGADHPDDGDVVGCLYVYPPSDEQLAQGHDAEVRSWVIESHADLDPPFRRWVLDWLTETWPFANPFYQLD